MIFFGFGWMIEKKILRFTTSGAYLPDKEMIESTREGFQN